MILDYIRKIIPIKYRQGLGLWTLRQAGKSKLLLNPYFLFLCGKIPKNLTLTKDDCYVAYKGHRIYSPCDGILAFIEVLQDRVYEKYYSPKTGDVVVDIGAYVGMFSVLSSLDVGDSGMVIAIEPARPNLVYLRKNVTGLKNVIIVDKAMGSTPRNGFLTISNASPCHSLIMKDNGKTDPVKVDTLDNVLRGQGINRVDFIKIDAEGSELDILKGAVETLNQKTVKLAIAAYHSLPSGVPEMDYIVRFLTVKGFTVRVCGEYVYAEK